MKYLHTQKLITIECFQKNDNILLNLGSNCIFRFSHFFGQELHFKRFILIYESMKEEKYIFFKLSKILQNIFGQ